MQHPSRPFPKPVARFAVMVLFAWSLSLSADLSAQNVRDFRLPSGDETPAASSNEAPQGPVDERAGVEIAPRVIEEQPTTPAQITPEPTINESQSEAIIQPLPDDNEVSETANPVLVTPPEDAGSRQTAIASETANPQNSAPAETLRTPANRREQQATEPGFDTTILRSAPEQSTLPTNDFSPATNTSNTNSHWLNFASNYQAYLLLGLVLLIAIFAILFVRRRRNEGDDSKLAIESSVLASSSRPSPRRADTQGSAALTHAERAPTPPLIAIDPNKIELSLEIVSGSRSVMMFSLEFRIEVANRQGNAIRDIEILGEMTFAEAGSSSGAPQSQGTPLGSIARIGPHQARSVTGTLSLPLSQLKTIRQGSKALFIPLIHVSIKNAGDTTKSQSYVVGMPSATSAQSVHPLTLDGPPGGMPGLRAQAIRLGERRAAR